jgi:hypothetical protein
MQKHNKGERGMKYTKICSVCNREQPTTAFHKNNTAKDGLDNRCKLCKSEQRKKDRDNNYFKEYTRTKKSECKRKGIDFDLTPEYLESIWTGVCAISGEDIYYGREGRGSDGSQHAHLDRHDPSKGYVEGNVNWIAGRLNRIKYNATEEELEMILKYMKGRSKYGTM